MVTPHRCGASCSKATHDKEGAKEDQEDEVETGDDGGVVHRSVHNVGPSSKGGALEDGEHARSDIVESGDVLIRSDIDAATGEALWTGTHSAAAHFVGTVAKCSLHFARHIIEACFVIDIGVDLQTGNGEKEEEEKEHTDHRYQQRDSLRNARSVAVGVDGGGSDTSRKHTTTERSD